MPIYTGHVPVKVDFTHTFTWITSSWHQKKLTQPKTYALADCCAWIRALLAYCHKKAWNNRRRLKKNPRGVKQMAQETSNPLWKKYCFEIMEENSLLLKLVSDKIIELIFSIHDFSVEETNLKKKKNCSYIVSKGYYFTK